MHAVHFQSEICCCLRACRAYHLGLARTVDGKPEGRHASLSCVVEGGGAAGVHLSLIRVKNGARLLAATLLRLH